jgi:hypothetical protein
MLDVARAAERTWNAARESSPTVEAAAAAPLPGDKCGCADTPPPQRPGREATDAAAAATAAVVAGVVSALYAL